MTFLGASPTSGVLLWVGILIVLAMLGGLAMLMVRRSMLGELPDAGADGGLMDRLRGMVERGEMTRAEFDQARRTIVRRAGARRAPAPEQPGAHDSPDPPDPPNRPDPTPG